MAGCRDGGWAVDVNGAAQPGLIFLVATNSDAAKESSSQGIGEQHWVFLHATGMAMMAASLERQNRCKDLMMMLQVCRDGGSVQGWDANVIVDYSNKAAVGASGARQQSLSGNLGWSSEDDGETECRPAGAGECRNDGWNFGWSSLGIVYAGCKDVVQSVLQWRSQRGTGAARKRDQ